MGRAIALRFAGDEGVRLALVARNETKLNEVAAACRQRGAMAQVYPCDVTDNAAVEAMASEIVKSFGAPDLLVNNAGTFMPGGILETTPEEFVKQIHVNLSSAFYVTRAFLPSMLERKSGSIHFMASVASIRAYAGGAAYCASKHGLLGLARVVREETREHGIKTVIFLPGATRTASWDGTDLPDSRFIPPEDIANIVWNTHSLSPRTVVEEVLIRPQLGDI
jgi:NAD(P)-dependent dehydrogenase (short-subunit alcohol dehydrogenase family)